MLRRALPAPLLAIALALAACGGGVDSNDTTSEATTDPGLPPADDSAAGGAAGGTYLALPPTRAAQEDVRDLAPRSFERARYDETDGTLYVMWSTGVEPCYVLGGIELEQGTDQVTVTLLEGWLPDENGEQPVCIEIAEQVSTPVPLEAHLDGRAVIDGATGEPVPVEVITAEDAPSS